VSIDGVGPIVPVLVQPPVQEAPAPATRVDAAELSETVTPPKGVDPELWSMLTRDEQAFFAEQVVLGPLTYGPSHEANSTPAPRGQRIDVRA